MKINEGSTLCIARKRYTTGDEEAYFKALQDNVCSYEILESRGHIELTAPERKKVAAAQVKLRSKPMTSADQKALEEAQKAQKTLEAEAKRAAERAKKLEDAAAKKEAAAAKAAADAEKNAAADADSGSKSEE